MILAMNRYPLTIRYHDEWGHRSTALRRGGGLSEGLGPGPTRQIRAVLDHFCPYSGIFASIDCVDNMYVCAWHSVRGMGTHPAPLPSRLRATACNQG